MASRPELYQLVGRAVADPAFAAKVKQDPIAAAKSEKIELSPDQEQWLKGKPEQWERFVSTLQTAGAVSPLDCGTCIVDGH